MMHYTLPFGKGRMHSILFSVYFLLLFFWGGRGGGGENIKLPVAKAVPPDIHNKPRFFLLRVLRYSVECYHKVQHTHHTIFIYLFYRRWREGSSRDQNTCCQTVRGNRTERIFFMFDVIRQCKGIVPLTLYRVLRGKW